MNIEQAGDMNRAYSSTKGERDPKTETLIVRLSKRDLDVVKAQAAHRKQKMSQYIRDAIHLTAEST